MVADASELAAVFGEALAGDLGDLAERGRDLAGRLDAANAELAPRLLAMIAL